MIKIISSYFLYFKTEEIRVVPQFEIPIEKRDLNTPPSVILREVAGSMRYVDSATSLRFAQNDRGGISN